MGEVRTLVGQGVGATTPLGQGAAQHVPLLLTTKEAPKVNEYHYVVRQHKGVCDQIRNQVWCIRRRHVGG